MKYPKYRLVIFPLITSRIWKKLLLLMSLLLGLGLLEWVEPIFGKRWLWIWVAVGATFGLFLYATLFGRRGGVRLLERRFRLSAPFWSFSIAYSMVGKIKMTTMAHFYKQAGLSDREFDFLEPIYNEKAVLVVLQKMPAWWRYRHLFFPNYLFTPDGKGLLLVVADWQGLGQALNKAVVAWVRQDALPTKPALMSEMVLEEEGEVGGEWRLFPPPHLPLFLPKTPTYPNHSY